MFDRQISATTVVAYALWSMCMGLWTTSWLTGIEAIGRLSLIMCGAAATATVRSYCVELSQRISNALLVTRDVSADRPMVRPLR